MRETLATRALKHLSLRIGLLWAEPNGLDVPFGKMPDAVTADAAIKLIEVYIRARAAYDEGDYLGTIGIATEDET